MTKLHLGSGGHVLPGWHNLDLLAQSGVIRCDLTKPLPYASNSVSFIFTEHFIEHLDEVDGFNLLKECFRVLMPWGRIRITCPDLRRYVEAYLNWSPSGDDVKNFASGTDFLNYATLGEAKSGLKYLAPIRYSTDHGHKYYYDEIDMTKKLTKIGFKDIVRCQISQSLVPELRNLEKRPPSKDMTLEATKKIN